MHKFSFLIRCGILIARQCSKFQCLCVHLMTLQWIENRQEAVERRTAEAEHLNNDVPVVPNDGPHHHIYSMQAKSDFLPYHEGEEVQLFTHRQGIIAPGTASAHAVKSVDLSAAEVRLHEGKGKQLADPESAFHKTPRNNLFARFNEES